MRAARGGRLRRPRKGGGGPGATPAAARPCHLLGEALQSAPEAPAHTASLRPAGSCPEPVRPLARGRGERAGDWARPGVFRDAGPWARLAARGWRSHSCPPAQPSCGAAHACPGTGGPARACARPPRTAASPLITRRRLCRAGSRRAPIGASYRVGPAAVRAAH